MIEPALAFEGVPLYLNALYGWIYLFHMPAFVIVSGYLAAKSSSVEFKRTILVPLLSFTVLYELLNYILYGSLSNYLVRFMPYWLLWYLFSLYVWRTLMVLYPRPVLLLVIGLCVSLLFGFLGGLGSLFGLARTVYFFPFFVFGYALSEGLLPRLSLRPSPRWFAAFVALTVGLLIFYFCVLHDVMLLSCGPDSAFYRHCFSWFVSVLYGTKGYWGYDGGVFVGVLLRIVVYVISFLLAYSFVKSVMPKPFFFTGWGGNTLYVFLWHGFVAKVFLSIGVFPTLVMFGGVFALLCMVLVSVFLTWLFSKEDVAFFTERYIFAPVWVGFRALWRSLHSLWIRCTLFR